MKKGSAAAKAWGRKMKKLRAAPKRKKRSISTTKFKPRKNTMVKKRVKRRATRKASAKILGVSMAKVGAAMAYGAMRARTSNMLSPYTSKLPLGNIGDEAGMIAVSVLAKKYLFKKAGFVRDALNSGQIIEFARIGDAAISGDIKIPFLSGSDPATASVSGNIF